jgi:hypothetical protein
MGTTLVLDKNQKRLRRYVRILQLLAETDDKLNKNGIWCWLKKEKLASEPTILYAIRDLQKWGMVDVIKTKRVVPGGKYFKYYKLTRTGIENLITAGVIRTKSVEPTTIKLLLFKYREQLPYADGILDLWPVFIEKKVEDVAERRLASFITGMYGEQLYYYARGIERAGWEPPNVGALAMTNMLIHGIYSSSADDDIETFVDPSSSFVANETFSANTNNDKEKWSQVVDTNEKFQKILIRATLKNAHRLIQKSNEALELLAVNPTRLKEIDPQTYEKFLAELRLLQSKVAIDRSRIQN